MDPLTCVNRARGRIRTDDLPITSRCSGSTWTAAEGSSLLTLDASSVQTAPDGYRRIVWMIKRMIKGHPTENRMARRRRSTKWPRRLGRQRRSSPRARGAQPSTRTATTTSTAAARAAGGYQARGRYRFARGSRSRRLPGPASGTAAVPPWRLTTGVPWPNQGSDEAGQAVVACRP